jgi:hypothetical protein
MVRGWRFACFYTTMHPGSIKNGGKLSLVYFSMVIRSFVIAKAADTCLKSNSNQSSITMSMLVSQW